MRVFERWREYDSPVAYHPVRHILYALVTVQFLAAVWVLAGMIAKSQAACDVGEMVWAFAAIGIQAVITVFWAVTWRKP